MMAMTQQRVIEITSAHTYIGLARREVFVEYRSGLPFWFFSRGRSGDAREFWAFGVYIVVNPRPVPPR
jgi:hypothetical protein